MYSDILVHDKSYLIDTKTQRHKDKEFVYKVIILSKTPTYTCTSIYNVYVHPAYLY